MAHISFDTLWDNHPLKQNPPITAPCSSPDGTKHYDNQCAIKMGECLHRSGISLHGFHGAFCWHKHERRHPLRAEQLGKWLASSHSFLRSVDIAVRSGKRQRSYNAYTGMTGIVLFRNFWGHGNQGDHVDLWDGYEVAGGGLDYFERSEEIWFWEIA